MMLSVVVLLVSLCASCVGASSLSYKNGSNENIRCMEKERQALLSFRAGLTVTSDGGLLPSWSSKDCCKWSGVECSDQTGHVIELNLPDPFGLAGKISPALLELRELTYLDLSFIDFENRPIPQFLGSFTKLKHLDLSNCSLAGIVPSQLGNLSNLNYLALSSDPSFNLSVENIDWLSRLSSLENLYMNGVDLSRATNWVDIIKTLPFLSTLDFSHCQLSNVMFPSSSINSSSTSIENLYLSSNGFTSSSMLFNLSSSLVLLSLKDNMLKGPDLEIFGDYMESLQYLELSYNLLEGMLPNSFGNLCNLVQLDMQANSLSGNLSDFLHILSSGSRCTSTPTLELLAVDSNKLYGPLPDGIIRFSSLRQLTLSRNQLNGTLTKNVGKLSQLEWLDLFSNSLTGIVSEAHFSNLSHLKILHLSGNALHIKVSPRWSPRFQLSSIKLMSCNLGPLFPNWIRTQKYIIYLDISNTGISENIPPWFWDFSTQFRCLNLSSNKIGGILPNFNP